MFILVHVIKQPNCLSRAATLIRHVYDGVYIFFYCSFMTLSYHLHLINETWMKNVCLRELFSEKMEFDFNVYGACVLFREIPPKNLTENFNEFRSRWTLKRMIPNSSHLPRCIFHCAYVSACKKKKHKSFRILTYIHRLWCFGANGCLSTTKEDRIRSKLLIQALVAL